MTTQGWPEPSDRSEKYTPPPAPPATEPVPDEHWQGVGRWGTEQLKERGRDYAIGKATEYAARTALGRGFMFFFRWVWIAEWGALLVAIGLGLLGIIGLIQKDTFWGIVALVLAVIAVVVWRAVRWVRRFIERQIDRAWQRFQELVAQGAARLNDWPSWFRRNRSKFR